MRRFVIFLLLVGIGSWAQKAQIDEKEIGNPKTVPFLNRSLRKASPELIQEQIQFGKKLAEMISQDPTTPINTSGIRWQRIQPTEESLGADIIQLDPSFTFDHINSLSRILSGYIESAYQYNPKNAETLSQYILYYNAAHRSEGDFFESKYNSELMDSINPIHLGIDTNYKNWAGKTGVIIPIEKNVLKDSNRDIVTDELEQNVNEEVFSKEKNPDSIKKMEQEKEKMDSLQKEKILEEQKIVQDRIIQTDKEIAKSEKELAKVTEEKNKKQQELEALKEGSANPKEVAKKESEIKKLEEQEKKVEEKISNAQETKAELKNKEESIQKKAEDRGIETPAPKKEESPKPEAKKEEPKKVEESKKQDPPKSETKKEEPKKPEAKKEDPPKKEESAKVEELKKELKEAKDELKKKEEKSENVIGDKIAFLKFVKYDQDGHYNHELWMLDPIKDDALFKSPFDHICSKDFLEIPKQGILVLGYLDEKTSKKHNLILLDSNTLQVKKSATNHEIYWKSFLRFVENKLYTIESFEGKFYLSRFQPDLSFEARSSEPVEENSEITFFKDKIFITGKSKGGEKTIIHVFQRSDLKHSKTIEP
jgi:hypothetical protein